MARIHMNFTSYSLRMNTDVTVIIPTSPGYQRQTPLVRHSDFPECLPILYLLHGFAQDYTSWANSTDIEELAQKHGLAVVMPSGYNSGFINMKYGQDFSTYLVEELPELIGRVFPVSHKPEETALAGFSLGGYGAMVNALLHPDKYGAMMSFAGNFVIESRIKGETLSSEAQTKGVFGDPPVIEPDIHDIFSILAASVKQGRTIPRIFACCGTEDARAYPRYEMMKKHCESLSVPAAFSDGPGIHDMRFCNRLLPAALDWLFGS